MAPLLLLLLPFDSSILSFFIVLFNGYQIKFQLIYLLLVCRLRKEHLNTGIISLLPTLFLYLFWFSPLLSLFPRQLDYHKVAFGPDYMMRWEIGIANPILNPVKYRMKLQLASYLSRSLNLKPITHGNENSKPTRKYD